MRVVTGEARGRKLVVPAGRDVRPTSDRVREAIFSSLGDLVVGVRVLDLFAGSGALGIEALSRGAARAVFVERSPRAIEAVRRNLATTGLEDRSRVIKGDATTILGRLGALEESFDLVFVDPPYDSDLIARSLEILGRSPALARGAIVVAEHRARNEITEPESLRIRTLKSYGDTAVTTLEKIG